MVSLSMVDKRGSFFECLLTLWALWSGSKTGTGTAVFVEDSSGSYVYKKKTFFFSGHSFAQKQLKKKFQLLFWERFRLPWQMAHGWESKRATCIEHKKTFSFVKLLHWLNIFETFCKKKNSCMELNIFRSKTVSQIATLFLLLFGQDWRKHDCFVLEM